MVNGTLASSSESVLVSSFSNRTTMSGLFCSPSNHLQQHPHGNQLSSDDLLDDDNDLSGLSNGYTETEQQELDEFAHEFNEQLEALGETGCHEQSGAFGHDSSGETGLRSPCMVGRLIGWPKS